MRRSLLALALACALTACGGGGDAGSGDSGSTSAAPTEAVETPVQADPRDAATEKACTDTGLAFAPLADGLAGGDLESALLTTQVPAFEPSGTAPTVEMALARMELELSFAKQAVELGVFGAEARADLQAAYDNLATVCAGIGSEF